VRLFGRREETLNEKLLREAGLSADGAPAAKDPAVEPADDQEQQAGHEVVFTVEAPGITGSNYDFVTLPDGSVVVDEDAPDISDLADAVELDFAPPYSASAVRQSEDYWLVTARPIRVERLALAGEELELSFVDGVATLRVDGRAADPDRVPSKLMALGEQEGAEFVVRATRLDGDLWQIVADPL
jgi:hypothetical protein